MAAKKKAAEAAGGVAGAVESVKSSPYVQRIVEDEDLRDNLRTAYEAGRDAYDRLTNGKAPHKALLEDKKLQKSLQEATSSLKEAGDALRDGPKKKKRKGFGGMLLLAVVGAGVALGVSEDLRNKVLDALFGKEEEFEYTSTTSPASSPSPSGTAA
jgi:hypothetical protein